MTVFVIAFGFLFLLFTTFQGRRAFYTYIALIPFMPAYFAIPLGIGGAGLSVRRILVYVLMMYVVAICLAKSKMVVDVGKNMLRWRFFFASLFTIFAAKLIGTITSNELVGLAYWLDELAEIMVILFLAAYFITDKKQFVNFLTVILISAIISQLLVLIEAGLGHNLLYGLVSIEVSTVGENVLEGRSRDGVYRAMGLFDNPLSLAEYSCWIFAFAYTLLKIGVNKWLAIATIALVPLVLYLTSARSGFVVLVAVLVVWLYQRLMPAFSTEVRYFIKLLLFVVESILAFLFLKTISSKSGINWVIDTFLSGSESENISSFERLNQYIQIIQAMSEAPWFGYGIKNHLISDIGVNLDSYYLRILIEAGFVGLCGFICLIIAAIQLTKSANVALVAGRRIALMFPVFVGVFAFYKFFLSMNGNNIYFYLIIGVLIGFTRAKGGGVNTLSSKEKPL